MRNKKERGKERVKDKDKSKKKVNRNKKFFKNLKKSFINNKQFMKKKFQPLYQCFNIGKVKSNGYLSEPVYVHEKTRLLSIISIYIASKISKTSFRNKKKEKKKKELIT